ncbi:MAG: hypothetical protein ACN4GZ_08800 [Acidimicrobiales bacterium]
MSLPVVVGTALAVLCSVFAATPVSAAAPSSCEYYENPDGTFEVSWTETAPDAVIISRTNNGNGPYWRGRVDNPGLSFSDGTSWAADVVYQIQHQVNGVNSDFINCTLTQAPPLPEISCEVREGSAYQLLWEGFDTAVSYRVERSLDSGATFDTIRTLPATVEGYADNQSNPAEYRIDALEDAGDIVAAGTCEPYSRPIPSPNSTVPGRQGGGSYSWPQIHSAPQIGALNQAGGLCDYPANSEIRDFEDGFSGTMVAGVQTTISNSFFMAPQPGQTYLVTVSGEVTAHTAPGAFGGTFRMTGAASQQNYTPVGVTGGKNYINRTFSVSTPGYKTLTMQNWYTVATPSGIEFDLDLDVVDSQTLEPIDGSKFLNRCELFDLDNWSDWGLYWELAQFINEEGVIFVPGYDCAQIVINGQTDWWTVGGCAADIAGAGITADIASTLKAATAYAPNGKPVGLITGINTPSGSQLDEFSHFIDDFKPSGGVGAGPSGEWIDEIVVGTKKDMDQVVQQMTETSCTSACGEMLTNGAITQQHLLNVMGEEANLLQLEQALGAGWQAVGNPESVLQVANDASVFAASLKPTNPDLLNHTVIVQKADIFDDTGHYLVLDPWDKSGYLVDMAWIQKWVDSAVWSPTTP